MNVDYGVLDLAFQEDRKNSGIIESLACYRSDDGAWLKVDYVSSDASYQISQENETIVSADFTTVWLSLARFLEDRMWIVIDQARYRRLCDDVDAIGYAPPSSTLVVTIAEFLRYFTPEIASQSVKDAVKQFGQLASQSVDKSLSLAVRRLYFIRPVIAHIFQLLDAIPLITLQTIALIMDRETGLYAFVQAQIDVAMTRKGLPSQVNVIHDLAFHQAQRLEEREEIEAIEADEGTLQALLDQVFDETLADLSSFAFEKREGQREMAKRVSDVLLQAQSLVVQAGTGTGKSLGYLYPAILYASLTRQRVVVATHTVALQEQLYNKEIPIAQQTLSVPFKSALLKGRSNYVCLRKAANYVHGYAALSREEQQFLPALLTWLTKTSYGDREEIALNATDRKVWNLVQSETESCISKRCPFFQDCYYFAARQRAFQADLIITNHSLVLSDVMADHRVLPSHKHLILDEAHHLEEQATKSFGSEVKLDELLYRLDRLLHSRQGGLREMEQIAIAGSARGHEAFSLIAPLLGKINRQLHEGEKDLQVWLDAFLRDFVPNDEDGEFRITKDIVQSESYVTILSAAEALANRLDTLSGMLADYDRFSSEIDSLSSGEAEQTLGLIEDGVGQVRHVLYGCLTLLDVVMMKHEEDAFVGWVQSMTFRAKKQLVFFLAPIMVGSLLASALYEKRQSLIFTSATLTVHQSLHYFIAQVGLTNLQQLGMVQELIVASPFAYERQALIAIPDDLAAPETEDYLLSLCDAIEKIVVLAKGRTLVLFTSYQLLLAVHKELADRLLLRQIRIFAQGFEDQRRTHLIDQFKQTDRAVLFGVQSFWEGIDIKGDDLRCLIIVKLPFDVPTHPIVKARSDRLTRMGKKPFFDYALPQAVIRFTQGVGRLIRAKDDRGVIFVFDQRIRTTSYGKTFLRSIPAMPMVTGSLLEVCQYAHPYLTSL